MTSSASPVIEELPDGGFRVTVRYWDDDAGEVSVAGGRARVDPGNRRMRRGEDGWWERTYQLPAGVRCDYDVAFAEYPGGHDYFWWRETILDASTSLLAQ